VCDGITPLPSHPCGETQPVGVGRAGHARGGGPTPTIDSSPIPPYAPALSSGFPAPMSRRKPRGRPLDGWLIIDKPPGLTSTDVVNRVRRAFDAQKAGHGGTLDPLATGVLPIAFGAATKTVPYVMDGTKLYRFTLRFGESSATGVVASADRSVRECHA
jgi:hypothetical protein